MNRIRAFDKLDRPRITQYGDWISGIVLRGDFGLSFKWDLPVNQLIRPRLGLTFVLSFSSLMLVWIVAIPLGAYSAVHQYSIGDYVATVFGFIGLAIPNFLFALILINVSFHFLGASVGRFFSPDCVNAPWSSAKLGDVLGEQRSAVRQLLRCAGGQDHDAERVRRQVDDRERGHPRQRSVADERVPLGLSDGAFAHGGARHERRCSASDTPRHPRWAVASAIPSPCTLEGLIESLSIQGPARPRPSPHEPSERTSPSGSAARGRSARRRTPSRRRPPAPPRSAPRRQPPAPRRRSCRWSRTLGCARNVMPNSSPGPSRVSQSR
ncbi:MAG: ABC transporter permease [Trueperaceae bacterium]|nr:ABC transporter permease [Trueperaceae bacterium]